MRGLGSGASWVAARWCAPGLAAALGLASALSSGSVALRGDGTPTWRRTPQDLAFLPSGRGVVLYQDGRVYTFDARTGHLGARPVYEVPPAYSGLALVATTVGGQEWIHVLVEPLGDVLRQTHLLRIPGGGGRASWNWVLSERSAVDLVAQADGRNAWLLTEDGRVYECELMGANARARQVGSASFYARLGSAAWDTERQRLLIGQSYGDEIYTLRLAAPSERGRLERFAKIKGAEVTSLAVDSARGHLYVADAAQEKIWDLELSAPKLPHPLVSEAARLRDPVALVVGPEGLVWVADTGARAVFALSPSGGRAVTLGPPPP